MEQLERLFSARGFAELESEFRKRWPERATDRGFIIDDQDADDGLVHKDSLFLAWAGMAA